MARSGVRVDEVIQAPGAPVGEVHDRLLAAMAADGDYQAVQVGSDRFQFARTFRPTWAIVTACVTVWVALIGIVFLFVRTTETCLAVIESDHRGTRLRLQGRISSAALGRVRAAMVGEQPGSVWTPAPVAATSSPAATDPHAPVVGAPVASTYPQVEAAGSFAPPVASPLPTPSALPGPATGSTPSASPAPPAPGVPVGGAAPGPAPVSAAAVAPPPFPGPVSPQPAPERPSAGQPPAFRGTPPSIAPPTPAAPSGPALPAGSAGDHAERFTLGRGQVADWGQGGRREQSGSDGAAVVIPAPPPDARDHELHSGAPVGPAGGGQEALVAVLDDGTPVPLTELTLIGRDPSPAPGEDAALVAFDDPTRSVSKTHLAIQRGPHGLVVVDRNSTNGASVIGPDGRETPLSAGVPAPVGPGGVVRFGERTLTVTTHSHVTVGGAS